MKNKVQLFEEKKIRSLWDADKEEWFFSIVDVCGALSEQTTQRGASNYWAKLKERLKEEGSQLLTICQQLKMQAADGKSYSTDAFDTKGILRAIQSIPSPKAEPFKMWLAQVGSDRLDEIADPEKAFIRAESYYRAKGYTDGWIKQRLQGIDIRKKLTNEWEERGVSKEQEYAILTNEMTKAWSGLSVKQYKQFKNIKKESLRDNMTDLELTLNQLAEVTTTAFSKQAKPKTFEGNVKVARRGGGIVKKTRLDIEKELGSKIVSPLNASDKKALEIRIKNKKGRK